jgi:hypothetical protein
MNPRAILWTPAIRQSLWFAGIALMSIGVLFVLGGFFFRFGCMVGLPPVPTVCTGNAFVLGLGLAMVLSGILALASGWLKRGSPRPSLSG